jgi:hypothetical protein
MYLKIIRDLLVDRINAIDTGNSNISEESQLEIIELFSRLSNPEEKMSKYQSVDYINKHGVKISRATFDNYVKDGKLPKGKHQQGFTEIF